MYVAAVGGSKQYVVSLQLFFSFEFLDTDEVSSDWATLSTTDIISKVLTPLGFSSVLRMRTLDFCLIPVPGDHVIIANLETRNWQTRMVTRQNPS